MSSIVDSPDVLAALQQRKLAIRRKHNVTVVALKKAGSDKTDINLDPDRPFEAGDVITLLGSNEDTVKIAKVK